MQEEMTFRELLGIVFAKWRMILVFGLVFALLLGGYTAYNGMIKAEDGSQQDAIEKAYRLEKQLYDSQKNTLQDDLDQLELQKKQAEAYYENSLLMQIDPYNKNVAKISFRVNADIEALANEVPEAWQVPTSVNLRSEREARIIDQYYIIANGVSLSQLLSGTPYAQVEDQYLDELVSVGCYQSGVLTIEAITTEKLDGMKLAEKLYQYCQEKTADVSAAVGAHTVELVDAVNVVRIDTGLANSQLQAQSRSNDIALQLSNKAKELQDLKEPSHATTSKNALKYAILGGVAGACVGAVIAFFGRTMGSCFQNGANLAQAVSARYLGNLKPYSRKRGLDALAEKLLGADVFGAVATEDRMPLLAANIREAAGDKRKLLVTGMRAQNELEAMAEKLQAQLGTDFQLIVAANLIINADGIRQLKDVDGVVMFDNEKTANIERVQNTKKYLDEAKVNLVGIVWA